MSQTVMCGQRPTLEPGQGLVAWWSPTGRGLAEANGAPLFQPPLGLAPAEGVVGVNGLNVVKGRGRGRFSDCRDRMGIERYKVER